VEILGFLQRSELAIHSDIAKSLDVDDSGEVAQAKRDERPRRLQRESVRARQQATGHPNTIPTPGGPLSSRWHYADDIYVKRVTSRGGSRVA
jgi:hypothetical protein